VNAVGQGGNSLALGVDVGGTKLLGVALDATNEVVAEVRLPTPRSLPTQRDREDGDLVGEEVAAAVAQVLGSLVQSLSSSGLHRPGDGLPLLAVGVGAPGMVDRQGVLRFAPNLPAGHGADLRTLVARLGRWANPVIENDATCATLAEHALGAAQGRAHAVVITLGTGIGGGIVSEGEVMVGAHGFAGEIGHMVVDTSGPLCPCGRRGCWERMASGSGLGRLAREAAHAGRLGEVVAQAGGDPDDVRGEHVTRAAAAGDPGALAVFDELGYWVAVGLANLAAVLDPECMVLGGGLAEAGEILLAPTRAAFATLLEAGSSRPPIDIVAALLGDRAGAIGAALFARRGQ
jgi:glucokinase